MQYNQNNKNLESLVKAVLSLKNEGEAKRFLRDLLTEDEIEEFANRWLAAQMLDRKISYTEIRDKTGLSSTTIARISKWLKTGRGGYQLMLKRYNLHHSSSVSFGKGLR
jgi:TrpR-related protein YerC/YecD